MRQLIYTKFITNNRALFHWCLEENLVKHQKVSEYCDHDFMSELKFFVSIFQKVEEINV